MKRRSLRIKLALLLCAAITIVSAATPSLAYIAARSNTLRNSFRVEYLPPQDIQVPVMIQKSMINLSDEDVGPGGFAFRLTNTDTGESKVALTSAEGWATMYLPFTAEDVGKTYYYRLNELNNKRENVIYDETVYDISITLLLNEMHEMSAELTLDGQPVAEIVAEYENKYYVPIPLPDTGDQAHPLLWMAMLILSITGLIILRKNRTIFRRQ